MLMKSFTSSKLALAIGLSAALFLSGCVTTGSSLLGGGQADSRLTTGSDAQFFSKSGFQACAAGAGIAALACLASNSSNKTSCMIVAGIASCGIAMGGNYYLDQRRSEFANTNERLQAYTTDIQADTQRIIQRTETASAVIQDDKKHLQTIQRQIANKQIDTEKAKAELTQIDKNIELLNKELANMHNRADNYQEIAQKERAEGANTKEIAALDRNILNMRDKINVLKTEVDTLYSQRDAIKLG